MIQKLLSLTFITNILSSDCCERLFVFFNEKRQETVYLLFDLVTLQFNQQDLKRKS
ncbi:hypothetical protein K2F_15270 [Enterococcus thailandicus]|nr:hypothetical protein K2F_15270 [Enterococcus thailandicus]